MFKNSNLFKLKTFNIPNASLLPVDLKHLNPDFSAMGLPKLRRWSFLCVLVSARFFLHGN
jgi:hypothetical protein